jgi:hypothetical protein
MKTDESGSVVGIFTIPGTAGGDAFVTDILPLRLFNVDLLGLLFVGSYRLPVFSVTLGPP